MVMKRQLVKMKLAFLVLGLAFVAAFGAVVMLLWNALVPELFGGPVIGFWQAAGLLVLCRILLGGFGGHGGPGGRWHRMSPEERERFRDGMRQWKTMSRDEQREFRRGFGGGCGPRAEPVREVNDRAAE
jgi:hypothetical protein